MALFFNYHLRSYPSLVEFLASSVAFSVDQTWSFISSFESLFLFFSMQALEESFLQQLAEHDKCYSSDDSSLSGAASASTSRCSSYRGSLALWWMPNNTIHAANIQEIEEVWLSEKESLCFVTGLIYSYLVSRLPLVLYSIFIIASRLDKFHSVRTQQCCGN